MRGKSTRHGDIRRFVEENYLADPNGPCVVPPFSAFGNRVRVSAKGTRRPAHNYATELRLGPAPDGMVSCHDCREPDCIVHTRWDTQANNIADMDRDGTRATGEQMPTHVLSEADVRTIRVMLADGVQQTTIAEWFGVAQSSIARISTNRTWRHLSCAP